MHFYSDEDFAFPVVVALRRLGHDVRTVQEDGRQGAPNLAVLAAAHNLNRVVLTFNRRHFEQLHRDGHPHSGIVSCTRDSNFITQAERVHNAVSVLSLGRWCLRVNRKP